MMDITQAWQWQQWFIASSMALNLIIYTTCHGKSRGEFNGFVGIVNFALGAFVLGTGGFFS